MPELKVHQSVLLTDLALCVNRWRLFSPGWYACVLAKVRVPEYLVAFNEDPVELHWHRLDAGVYRVVEADEDGIIRSHALPNCWIPLRALQNRDWWTVLACIERGVSRRANFE